MSIIFVPLCSYIVIQLEDSFFKDEILIKDIANDIFIDKKVQTDKSNASLQEQK